jgi:hypothetical protein
MAGTEDPRIGRNGTSGGLHNGYSRRRADNRSRFIVITVRENGGTANMLQRFRESVMLV